MYCTSCGKQIPDDAQFCRYCGATFAKNVAANYTTSVNTNNVSANAQPVSSGKKPFNLKLVLIPLLLLLVVGGILFVLNRNGEEDDTSSKGINKITEYDAEGNIEKYVKDFRFDSSGNVKSCNFYNAENEKIAHEERYYDAKGNFLIALRFSKIDDYNFCYVYEKEISDYVSWGFGSILEEGQKYKFECDYDQKGNLTETVMKNKDGDVLYTFNRIYDEKGNNIKFEVHESNDRLAFYKDREYDENNRIIKETLFANMVQQLWTPKYQYDSSGRLESVEETFYGYYQIKFEYDKRGRLAKQTKYDIDQNVIRTTEYKYN